MAHLKDFMRTGREFTISLLHEGEVVDVKVWIQRPSSIQQDDCLKKANVVAAKHRAQYRDLDSDEVLLLRDQLSELSDDELIQIVTRSEYHDLLRQANQEVMFGEWGSKWDGVDEETGEGADIVSVIEALADKHDQYNDPDTGLSGEASEDPEVVRLAEIQQKFEAEVAERAEVLVADLYAPWKKKSREELIAEALKWSVNTDSQIAWFTEYRMWQLFYGCRYPEDHRQMYFDTIEEIHDLPEHVKSALLLYYDRVDGGPDNTKVLPTPQDSSLSSEPSEESVEA